MAHAQKPYFIFRRNGRVHLIWRVRQFSRLLAGEVCASAVVMLDTPCSEKVWRVLATHSIRQFPLHFPSRALPCAIIFQLDCTTLCNYTAHCGNQFRVLWLGLVRICGVGTRQDGLWLFWLPLAVMQSCRTRYLLIAQSARQTMSEL
jgi:hypothetical protein